MRRNHDITYLVHDNQLYALTKGQASPTSDEGFITKTTPYGAVTPLNPVALAIAAGASFVARSFAGDVDHLTDIIKAGITHKGFSLIDILQPCVSLNRRNTYDWDRERVYKITEEATDYDPTDRLQAFAKAQEWDPRIPIGVIFRKDAPTFEEQLPVLAKGTLPDRPIEPQQAAKLLEEFF
jgi:2-oxoglutarate ferredoxin oxidoreductase subunit beta